MRNINQAGLALIKTSEALKLKAYADPATGGEPYTVGWGHTGIEVHPNMQVTLEAANAILASDLNKFERGVSEMVKAEISDNQFSALVCFAFNVGLGNLHSSTLLKMVNASDFEGAAKQFVRWNKAQGKVMNGLTKRREAESELFQS